MLHIGGADLCRAIHPCQRAVRMVALAAAVAAVLTGIAARPAQASTGAGGSGCQFAHRRTGQASEPQLRAAVVCLIDRQRTRRGLPALRASRLLDHSAQGWSNYMVAHGLFSHGANFAGRISGTGFRWSQVGENIAAGYGTPAAVVRAWMASPGHCRNILSPGYADVGTGVDAAGLPGGRPGTWTQDFALPLGEGVRSGNWSPARGCPYR
jgi:uncharacterized protein YkwD